MTERTRELYKNADIPVRDDVRVLESMEDGTTGDIQMPN